MQSQEIRTRFLTFFKTRGHSIIPSASVVPEHDPSVLFTTAGMHPLVPYLLGGAHPLGKRLANVQKCIRMQDIDEVGDATHDTFFEMLGNWSLGDPASPDGIGQGGYFKQEAIKWSYELLISKEIGFGLDPARLYITCFAGDESAPRDDESAHIWQSVGIPENRIYFLPKENNWWSPGDTGPCGPDTEMFYDVSEKGLGDLSREEFLAADERQEVVEIWNDVFMEYEKREGKVVGKLSQKNVDTGAGLERLAMVLQGKKSIFDTDLFTPIVDVIRSQATKQDEHAERVVADHIRTAVFMIADGVLPSNTDRGYILRRILRRAVRYADTLGIPAGALAYIAESVHGIYSDVYSELSDAQTLITETVIKEEGSFRKTLARGIMVLNTELYARDYFPGQAIGVLDVSGGFTPGDNNILTGKFFFNLYQSHGFPFELSIEELQNRGRKISSTDIDRLEKEFLSEMKAHQELSRAGAEQKFKGGLAGHSDMEVRYHTATHLLHQALTDVLGEGVGQMGSNITSERLRFDFSHAAKMTDEEKQKVEDIVNKKIKEDVPVQRVVLSRQEAESTDARHFFKDKYGDEVSVYFIGSDMEHAYSKEFCGGPHVTHTGELGHFKITKEEAVAAGVRRIKAVLE